ncbi:CCA tRNA nucleotidyltransferase [candidate division WOR-3 bacterium]|nr:CCA tRNA nucleotidyltransferase [candidate division WOR-3 bacterium]
MTDKVREAKTLLQKIALEVKESGGRLFEVGGTVRDVMLGRMRRNEDIDAEVYGLSPDALEKILKKFGKVDLTGKSFAVYRIGNLEISLPRRDRRIGEGHKGFEVKADPGLSYYEACRRRDFTVNSVLKDALTGEIIDPLGGVKDMKTGILRACDANHFGEDPLRAYRAMRFAASLGFPIETNTAELCRRTDTKSLPRERIFAEIKKMLVEGDFPGRGFLAAHSLFLFSSEPEISSMVECSQDIIWHPEGSVFIHTVLSLDVAASLRENMLSEEDKFVFMLSVLFHDIGKTVSTKQAQEGRKAGRLISPGHQPAGAKIAKIVLSRWKAPKSVTERVSSLVLSHHRIYDLWKSRDIVTKGAMRRLFGGTELELLKALFMADKFGRGQVFGDSEEILWLDRTLRDMKIQEEQLKPIVMGRHLLKLGIEPSPFMGDVLKELYEAQLDGDFDSLEEGILLAKRIIESKKREKN